MSSDRLQDMYTDTNEVNGQASLKSLFSDRQSVVSPSVLMNRRKRASKQYSQVKSSFKRVEEPAIMTSEQAQTIVTSSRLGILRS
jgi:hypothetical protein